MSRHSITPSWISTEPASAICLGWGTARLEGELIGFANVAWDGGVHAFLVDSDRTSQRGKLASARELRLLVERHKQSFEPQQCKGSSKASRQLGVEFTPSTGHPFNHVLVGTLVAMSGASFQ